MDIFKTFRDAADPGKAVGMKAYMRDQFEFLGLATPVRKQLSREFLRTAGADGVDWGFVFTCWGQPEREFQYLGMDYVYRVCGLLGPGDVPRLRELVVTKSWWDTIDGLDRVVGDVALRHPQVNRTLLEWSVDPDIWLRRVAIDHQLLRKEQTDTGLLEQIIVNNLGHKEFFVNKAIGWSLREYGKTDPEWVRDFIERYRDRLANLSIREGGKYL
jgi:3-methyladenine DNA glycosylase AlkD